MSTKCGFVRRILQLAIWDGNLYRSWEKDFSAGKARTFCRIDTDDSDIYGKALKPLAQGGIQDVCRDRKRL